MYRILFIGPIWHGSDAGGLAKSLRRLGNIVQVVDPGSVIPVLDRGNLLIRGIRRIFTPILIKLLTKIILHEAKILKPHIMVVFKGEQLEPEVISKLKNMNCYVVNFYPDVSFMCHGTLLSKSMSLYDFIFTTKSFGPADLKQQLGFDVNKTMFVPHGYDPDVHRPLFLTESELKDAMRTDVSFIGTWSKKKEHYLSKLAENINRNQSLRIWGTQWKQGIKGKIAECIEGTAIVGDLYALKIQTTKINIAILSEIRYGASSGDRTTARTFQIPAIGGFMLHERTDELLQFYDEGKEVACFSSHEELSEKVQYYLSHDQEREKIRIAGHKRCVAENSLDQRAQQIIKQFERTVLHKKNTTEN